MNSGSVTWIERVPEIAAPRLRVSVMSRCPDDARFNRTSVRSSRNT
jgi:hypothetical protein